MSVDARLRELVPAKLVLPSEHTSAVITVPLEVLGDSAQLVAPGLDQVKEALARGSVEVVRSYCQMWTRFLMRTVGGRSV